MRFSLLSLFGLVLVAGLGCAALVAGSEIWASVVLSAAVLALAAATLAAVQLRGASRAFCSSFAVAGWAYLFWAFNPWFTELREELLTTKAVERLRPHLQPATEDLTWWCENRLPPDVQLHRVDQHAGGNKTLYFSMPVTGQMRTANIPAPAGSKADFMRIGQSLWTLLLALLGGLLGSWLWRHRQGRNLDAAT